MSGTSLHPWLARSRASIFPSLILRGFHRRSRCRKPPILPSFASLPMMRPAGVTPEQKTQFQPQLRLARSLGVRHTAVSFFSLHMIETSLGQRLRELRDKADLSLRELAKRSGISSPFLSDIELGRRFPSEEILGKLAAALNVPVEDLEKYDNRGPIADLKRLMDSDPKLGFAFRTAVEKVKSGELTAEDIIARLSKPPRKK